MDEGQEKKATPSPARTSRRVTELPYVEMRCPVCDVRLTPYGTRKYRRMTIRYYVCPRKPRQHRYKAIDRH